MARIFPSRRPESPAAYIARAGQRAREQDGDRGGESRGAVQRGPHIGDQPGGPPGLQHLAHDAWRAGALQLHAGECGIQGEPLPLLTVGG